MSAMAQGHFVTLPQGLRLHYLDIGGQGAGSGETVVFIHGSGPGASGHSNFKQNYPLFVTAGYRVIVPDLPGYGASDKPDTLYTLDFFVNALSGLLDALDTQRCILVGNSLGGAIAIKLALDQPQRVSRLVLMAPGGNRQICLQQLWNKTGEQIQRAPGAGHRVQIELPEGMTADYVLIIRELPQAEISSRDCA